MLNWFKKAEDSFTLHEKKCIVEAIQHAEKQTSGEIRVYIESKCRFVNPLDRARELFDDLNMYQTNERNAVLVYVAFKHRQLAVFADEGIFQKTGDAFWTNAVWEMLQDFNKENYVDGIVKVVTDIGDALHTHFPYQGKKDINELPDDIVFGR